MRTLNISDVPFSVFPFPSVFGTHLPPHSSSRRSPRCLSPGRSGGTSPHQALPTRADLFLSVSPPPIPRMIRLHLLASGKVTIKASPANRAPFSETVSLRQIATSRVSAIFVNRVVPEVFLKAGEQHPNTLPRVVSS